MGLDERHKETKRVTLIGAVVNLVLSALQIIFGWLTHSQALFADGIHTLSDLVSDFLVLFSSSQASKKADKEHPFGHGRIETLGSVILSMMLVAVGVAIAIRAYFSFIHGTSQQPEMLALVFAAIAILAKELLFRYTLLTARKIHSSLLESNALHHRSDVYSSLVVFIGIAGQLLGLPYFDIGAAFLVSLLIINMGIKLNIKAFKELIDTSLKPELVKQLSSTIMSVDGVLGIQQLRTRSMGGLGFIDTDIQVDSKISVSEGHYIATCVEVKIKKSFPSIQDIKVHIDPYEEGDIHQQASLLPNREALLFQLDTVWAPIDGHSAIKSVNIHYHADSTEIDIILPLSFAQTSNNETAAALKKAALSLPFITKLNIYFA